MYDKATILLHRIIFRVFQEMGIPLIIFLSFLFPLVGLFHQAVKKYSQKINKKKILESIQRLTDANHDVTILRLPGTYALK